MQGCALFNVGKMEYRYSNPIDIFGMKVNVVANYERYVEIFQRRFRELRHHTYEVLACPVCDSDQSEIAMIIHGFQYRRCNNCTHVYLRDAIRPEQLREYYTDSTVELPYSSTYSEDPEVQKIRRQSAASAKVEYISQYLSKPKGRWLDIACGNADFLAEAKAKGHEVQGIELSPTLVKVAKQMYGIEVFEGTLLDFAKSSGDEKYDVVGCIGIIDILPDLESYFRAAAKLVTKGGLIAINVPHYNSLTAAIQQAYHDQTIRFACPNVFHLFTERSLQEVLKRHGFEPIAMWFFGMDVYELINTISLESHRFRNSKARHILMNLGNEFQRVCDEKKFSDEVMIIGRIT